MHCQVNFAGLEERFLQSLQDEIPSSHFGASFMFDLSTQADNILNAVLIAVGTFALSVIVRSIVQAIVGRYAPTWREVAGTIGQAGVLLAGLALVIERTGVISAAVLLTVLTLFTAGASLSASNLIGDTLATLQILFIGYYRAGDLVTIAGGVHGKVLQINAFSTVLRTLTRDKVILSNSAVINETIQVHTGYIGHEVLVHVPVCSDHDRNEVVRLLIEVGETYAERMVGSEFAPKVFHTYGSSSENYTLAVYVADEFDTRHHYATLSIAAGNILNTHGIAVGETNDNRNEISGSIRFVNQVEQLLAPAYQNGH